MENGSSKCTIFEVKEIHRLEFSSQLQYFFSKCVCLKSLPVFMLSDASRVTGITSLLSVCPPVCHSCLHIGLLSTLFLL